MIVDPKHRFPLHRSIAYGDQVAELPHFASPVTRGYASRELQIRREGRLARASRRLFDVTMSLVMAVFLAPVMIMAAIAIAIFAVIIAIFPKAIQSVFDSVKNAITGQNSKASTSPGTTTGG